MCIIYTFLYPAPLHSASTTGKSWGYFPNSGNPESPIRCVAPPPHPPKIPKFQHPHFLSFPPSLPFTFPHTPIYFVSTPLRSHSLPPPPSRQKPTIIPFYTPFTPTLPHFLPLTPTKNATLFSAHFVKFCVHLLVYDIILI